MSEDATPALRRRRIPGPLKWLLIAVASVLGVLMLSVIVVMALGITVSGAPWRSQLPDAMSTALGREVRFEGPLEMVPTLNPAFKIGGISVANPAGFSTPFFASLEQATLQVDLVALLRGQVRVRELAAQGVQVHLERNGDARVNWLFELARKDEAPKPDSKPTAIALVEIERIDLRNLMVDYVGGPGFPRHEFVLSSLEGKAPARGALTVDMQGTVEGSFPYTMTFRGGSMESLMRRSEPWPVDFALNFLGTALNINGQVVSDAARASADLMFGLGTEDLSQLERLLQVSLPPVGASGLSARIRWSDGVLDVADLRGAMGRSVLAGNVKVDLRQAVPRIQGVFDLPLLDVTPFRSTQPKPAVTESKPAVTENKPGVDLQAIKQWQFQFRELGLVEADVALRVHRWEGLPGDVRDSALQVSLHQGVLQAPVETVLADVPLKGRISLDSAAATPAFALELGAQDSELGQLGRLLTGADGVQGHLDHFSLAFSATGANLDALARTLAMKLDIRGVDLTYGNVKGGRPVQMALDDLLIELPAGGRLQGQLRGALLRERFAAQFKGGDLSVLNGDVQWPIEFAATASGATISVTGQVAPPGRDAGTDLTLKFNAPRAGSVARWLGLSPKAKAAVAITGRVQVHSDEWRLSDLDVRLGASRLTAQLARVNLDRQPLVQARVRVDNLELAELEAMLPPPKPGPAKPVIELPILPKGIDLTDADVDMVIKRIALKPAPVLDLSFLGKIRNGKMHASPFGALYFDTRFSGALALDLRGKVPEATVWMAAEEVDVGRILNTLGLAESLKAFTQSAVLQISAKGHRLGDMLAQSGLRIEIGDGSLELGNTAQNALHIALRRAVVEAQPREPVHVDLDGAIGKVPVNISIATGSAAELLRADSHVPFQLTAEAAETQLALSGRVSLPITQKAVELDLRVAGKRVNSLDELARTPLPHWGPYSLRSRFRLSPAGYEMPGMTLTVASSELKGKGSVVTSGERPRIALQLAAPRVQLDDFKLEGWVLAARKEEKDAKPLSEEELRRKAKEASAQTERALSPEALRRQDVDLSVEVNEVLSGADRLGSGTLKLLLKDGRLALDPAQVSMPGGSARVGLSYFPDGKNIAIDAKVRVENFDYAVLARRAKPDTDLQGRFSLHFDMRAQTPSLDRTMQNGNGRIDFAVWPINMKSGVLDLWAVNLFVALVPAVDNAAASKVNCAFGLFNLKRGVLTEEALLMDTSRMRVAGKARVDFDSESLTMSLAPKAKRPEFFSLATPVGVSGKLTAPKINVSAGQVASTAAKFLASIITTPLQRLFSKDIPRDGADVCGRALEESRAAVNLSSDKPNQQP